MIRYADMPNATPDNLTMQQLQQLLGSGGPTIVQIGNYQVSILGRQEYRDEVMRANAGQSVPVAVPWPFGLGSDPVPAYDSQNPEMAHIGGKWVAVYGHFQYHRLPEFTRLRNAALEPVSECERVTAPNGKVGEFCGLPVQRKAAIDAFMASNQYVAPAPAPAPAISSPVPTAAPVIPEFSSPVPTVAPLPFIPESTTKPVITLPIGETAPVIPSPVDPLPIVQVGAGWGVSTPITSNTLPAATQQPKKMNPIVIAAVAIGLIVALR